jgi:hypothetical protein
VFRNQIVGLIRFSLVTTGSFYPGFDTVEAMSAFLFDPARLERRFRLFEALCLPCLKRQTDQDFTCVILTAADLPRPWADRLADLLAGCPWARIVPVAPMNHYKAVRTAFDTVEAEGFTHRTTFRLDDDDAVDPAHIARLRRLAAGVQHMDSAGPVALGFNRGLYLRFETGRNVLFEARERMPLSVGAALVAPTSHPDNVYRQNHRALGEFYNIWMDAETCVFLRTLHQDNKSNPHLSGSQGAPDDPAVDHMLRAAMGFDPEALRALRP